MILTADSRQRRNQLEVTAIVEGNAREFVLRCRGLSGDEIAEMVTSNLKRINNISRDQAAPFDNTLCSR